MMFKNHLSLNSVQNPSAQVSTIKRKLTNEFKNFSYSNVIFLKLSSKVQHLKWFKYMRINHLINSLWLKEMWCFWPVFARTNFSVRGSLTTASNAFKSFYSVFNLAVTILELICFTSSIFIYSLGLWNNFLKSTAFLLNTNIVSLFHSSFVHNAVKSTTFHWFKTIFWKINRMKSVELIQCESFPLERFSRHFSSCNFIL